jgi:hypothetical protein
MNRSAIRVMEFSWNEMRSWGLDYALQALPADSTLSTSIRAEAAVITAPRLPNPSSAGGFVRLVSSTALLKGLGGGWLDLQFDQRGAIVVFSDRLAKKQEWASASYPLGLLQYHTELDCHGYEHHEPDCELSAMRKEYLLGANGREYGKLGANTSVTAERTSSPVLAELWIKNITSGAATELHLKLEFAAELHTEAGAPNAAWLSITVPAAGAAPADRVVELQYTLVNKSATRLPESAFVTFFPYLDDSASSDGARGSGRWLMDKLGHWVSPLGGADGAPHGLHGVTSGVLFSKPAAATETGSMFFESLDAGLVSWGGPRPFPTPIHAQPDLQANGVSFVLFDNLWNTNCKCE